VYSNNTRRAWYARAAAVRRELELSNLFLLEYSLFTHIHTHSHLADAAFAGASRPPEDGQLGGALRLGALVDPHGLRGVAKRGAERDKRTDAVLLLVQRLVLAGTVLNELRVCVCVPRNRTAKVFLTNV
jgi:hypothetical protein